MAFTITSPLPLPWESTEPHPTHDEIVAAVRLDPEVLYVRKTFAFKEKFFFKFGTTVRPVEGENMMLVRQATSLRVPRVYAIYRFGKDNLMTMIVTEQILGGSISSWLDHVELLYLTRAQKDAMKARVLEQLRTGMRELRSIPAPDIYGSLCSRPYCGGIAGEAAEQGPFFDFEAVAEFCHGRFHEWDGRYVPDAGKAEVQRQCIAKLCTLPSQDRRPVFSHGDWVSSNILVTNDGVAWVVDWEFAGFYPAFYEYILVVKRFGHRYQPATEVLEPFPAADQIVQETAEAYNRL
ncbi:kinase-like domain-containing protein [Xylariaceae sp. FL1272]|nr:kinase-like domain-containing protein [Xylariaceae sp. FL1272]